MNLTDTIVSFMQQFPSGTDMSIQRKEQLLDKFGQVAFGGFGLAIFAGVGAIIYLIITKMILDGKSVWSGVLLLAFVVFAALSLAFVFLRETLNDQKQKLNPQLTGNEPSLIVSRAAGSLSDAAFQPAQSVIENTTDLLPVEPGTRKLQ
jgi:hypothetical protein